MAAFTHSQSTSATTFWQRFTRRIDQATEVLAPFLPNLKPLAGQSFVIDGLTVRCDQTFPTEPALLAAWEALYSRTPAATPFQSAAWQRPLLEVSQMLGRLRLFSVFDSAGCLIAVLPLELRGAALRNPGTGLSDYLDPLVDPERTLEVWPALFRALDEQFPGFTLTLDHLRQSVAGFTPIQHAALRADFVLRQEDPGQVARVMLPATWEHYLSNLQSGDRKELKRKLNKAVSQGSAQLDICADPATVAGELKTMFTWMQGSGGGKARKARWVFPKHFAAAAPELAGSKRLSVAKLTVDGRHAASTIVFASQHGPMVWNIAFDPALARWSPGIVLLGLLIQRSIEAGAPCFDLLRGRNEYKYRLGAQDFPLYSLTLSAAESQVRRKSA